jgi:hypothetical protein
MTLVLVCSDALGLFTWAIHPRWLLTLDWRLASPPVARGIALSIDFQHPAVERSIIERKKLNAGSVARHHVPLTSKTPPPTQHTQGRVHLLLI